MQRRFTFKQCNKQKSKYTTHRQRGRERERGVREVEEDTYSKTLFYEDCTLGAAKKNLSDNPGGAGSGTLYP